MRVIGVIVLAALAVGCSKDLDALRRGRDAGTRDAGTRDGGPSPRDAGPDSGREEQDSGTADAGPPDAGAPDAGGEDAGPFDAGCTCPTGCEAPPCETIEPSNVPELLLEEGTATVDLDRTPGSPHWVFYTNDGRIVAYTDRGMRTGGTTIRDDAMSVGTEIRYDRVDATGGADLAVFRIASLNVPDFGSITGAGARALVILVRDEARIAGTIDLSASSAGPGPGGGWAGGAGAPGGGDGGGGGGGSAGVANEYDRGGGGGGLGSRGGTGGSSTSGSPGGGAGGGPSGDNRLVPLRAGSGGGGGGPPGVGGGHGAGALQISAGTAIVLAASARIEAHGLGGGRGANGEINGGAGGGGGSGGGILLEAPMVTIDPAARIAANGGAGGQGGTSTVLGRGGENGRTDRRAICPADAMAGSVGGAGSWLDGVASGGGTNCCNGGGGGGGAGRIRINTLAGDETYAAEVFIPSFTSGLSTLGTIRLR